jgi:hypothetical protein
VLLNTVNRAELAANDLIAAWRPYAGFAQDGSITAWPGKDSRPTGILSWNPYADIGGIQCSHSDKRRAELGRRLSTNVTMNTKAEQTIRIKPM